MKKLKKLLFGTLLIIPLFFTSCQKNDELKKEITVKVETTGLIEQNIPGTKSFDIENWTWNYNTGTYTMTMTGQQTGQVYTFNKSISDLQTGFNIQVIPDTYTVTYTTVHSPMTYCQYLSDKLDIKINQEVTINSQGQTITLNSTNDDYLLVFDVHSLNVTWVWLSSNQSNGDPFISLSDYYYGYNNQEGVKSICYQTDYSTYHYLTVNCVKGKVYHVISNLNGGVTVTMSEMTEETIIL